MTKKHFIKLADALRTLTTSDDGSSVETAAVLAVVAVALIVALYWLLIPTLMLGFTAWHFGG